MAWNDWQYIQVSPSPKRKGYVPAYHNTEVPDNALRILLNDDADVPNPEKAQAFCKNYLSIKDKNGQPVCPTERPVVVFFTASFAFAKTLLGELKPETNEPKYLFDGLILDLLHQDSGHLEGTSVLSHTRKNITSPIRPTIIVTQLQNEAENRRTHRLNSATFAISKDPEAAHRLEDEIGEIEQFFQAAEEHHRIQNNPLIDEYKQIIGSSVLRQLDEFIGFLDEEEGESKTPIVILGETGTGKEAVARSIHLNDRVNDVGLQKFQPVLINSIPKGTLEGELFGVVSLRPSDYDSKNARPIKGYVESAAKGTLFIDEIGDVAPNVQAGLLRFLQEQKIRPVGGEWKSVPDVRCIFATHKNMLDPNETRIRHDFLFRIDGLTLRLPTLAERTEDHEDLVDYFISQTRAHEKAETDPPFSQELREHLIELCRTGQFIGNVRQLRMFINRIVRVSRKGHQITLADEIRARKHSLIEPGINPSKNS